MDNVQPALTTDGHIVYNGAGNTFTMVDGYNESTTYYFSAWSYNLAHTVYSIGYAIAQAGGANVLAIMFLVIALGLTVAMFITRSLLLGFPCLIFWALLGGYSYQQSTTTWDLYYLMFFSSMGMAIFSAYAAFALRRRDLDPVRKDWEDSGRYIDEGKRGTASASATNYMGGKDESDGMDGDIEHSRPSRRSRELHNRASDRRTGVYHPPTKWGEFK
jgi:hypothetical protein